MDQYDTVFRLSISKRWASAEEFHAFCREHGLHSTGGYKKYLIETLLKSTEGYEIDFGWWLEEKEEKYPDAGAGEE